MALEGSGFRARGSDDVTSGVFEHAKNVSGKTRGSRVRVGKVRDQLEEGITEGGNAPLEAFPTQGIGAAMHAMSTRALSSEACRPHLLPSAYSVQRDHSGCRVQGIGGGVLGVGCSVQRAGLMVQGVPHRVGIRAVDLGAGPRCTARIARRITTTRVTGGSSSHPRSSRCARQQGVTAAP